MYLRLFIRVSISVVEALVIHILFPFLYGHNESFGHIKGSFVFQIS